MKLISAIILLLIIQINLHAQSTINNNNTNQQKLNPITGTWRLLEYTNLDTLTGKGS